MNWDVLFYDAFGAEFEDLPEAVQVELLAYARLLEEFGPHLEQAEGRRYPEWLEACQYEGIALRRE